MRRWSAKPTPVRQLTTVSPLSATLREARELQATRMLVSLNSIQLRLAKWLALFTEHESKAQNSPGYAHWAKVFSLKQSAKTLLFLQENGLTDMTKLRSVAQASRDDFNALQSQIHAITTRIEQISTLQKHIGAYRKTRDVYAQYTKAKNKRKFYAEHEVAIDTHKAAKAYFERINLKKLPTIQMPVHATPS